MTGSKGMVAVFPDADPFDLAEPQANLTFSHTTTRAGPAKGKQADRKRENGSNAGKNVDPALNVGKHSRSRTFVRSRKSPPGSGRAAVAFRPIASGEAISVRAHKDRLYNRCEKSALWRFKNYSEFRAYFSHWGRMVGSAGSGRRSSWRLCLTRQGQAHLLKRAHRITRSSL